MKWGDADDQDSKYILARLQPVAFKKRGTVSLIPVKKKVNAIGFEFPHRLLLYRDNEHQNQWIIFFLAQDDIRAKR
jgi:hypothetical protein